MSTPFKMKGSPMQRNFGIGSPLKQDTEDKTPQAVKDLGLAEITDEDLERGVREEQQMAKLPPSEMKEILKKYKRGGKLTKEDKAIMDQYVKDTP
jgi:hypothetical protein